MAGELPTAGGFYSITLGVFFVALPFSRYMHIFTEIPLIFLRNAGLRERRKTVELRPFPDQRLLALRHLHRPLPACNGPPGFNGVQSVYFLRDLRERQPDRCGGQQLPDVRSLRTGLPGRYRTKYAAAEQPPVDAPYRSANNRYGYIAGNRPFAGQTAKSATSPAA